MSDEVQIGFEQICTNETSFCRKLRIVLFREKLFHWQHLTRHQAANDVEEDSVCVTRFNFPDSLINYDWVNTFKLSIKNWPPAIFSKSK